ncbi:hypothetical protein [Campylobacter jejuni]|nr:hypothetical protein [Campylobacter jejuni]
MNKPFYKLKRFYIPCGVLIALIIFISLTYSCKNIDKKFKKDDWQVETLE